MNNTLIDTNELRDAPDVEPLPPASTSAQLGAVDNGCLPGSEGDVRGRIVRVLRKDRLNQNEKYTQIARQVLHCLDLRGQFYFHAERPDFDSAMFFDETDKTLTLIRTDRFQSWLSLWTEINRADHLFKYLMRQVETVAVSPSHASSIIPERFWARRENAIYLSCGDGHLVKITGSEVRVLDNGADGVLFPFGSTLARWKLVAAADPFESCRVFKNATFVATHGKELLRAFVYSLPTNPKTKPPLLLVGDIGSGKTRLARAISELYGLPERLSSVEESRDRDFWTAMNAGGLLVLDNADTRVPWLAEAISSAATAAGKATRKLYTDGEEYMARPHAWLVITSAKPTFAEDPGLADRLLVCRMKRRTGATVDGELSDEVKANRDAGLSFIAQTLSRALADNRTGPPVLNPRHPDFAALAIRIGRAIGREVDMFRALCAAEADKGRVCLENDPIGAALLATIAHGPFQGPAAELLTRLRSIEPELASTSVKRLGKRLATLWPHIESVFHASKAPGHSGYIEYQLRPRG